MIMERPNKMQKINHSMYGVGPQGVQRRSPSPKQIPARSMSFAEYSTAIPTSTLSMENTPPLPSLAYSSYPNQFTFQFGLDASSGCGFESLPAFSGIQQPSICGPDTANYWPVYTDPTELDEDMMTPSSQQGLNTPPTATVNFEQLGLEASDFCSPAASYPSTSQSPASLTSCARTEETSWSGSKSLSLQESLPQTQQSLARIYHELRCQQDNQSISSDQAYHKAHSQELFALVLSLWTSLRSLTLVRWDENSFDGAENDAETTFKLSFMAVTVVLDMYKNITISSRRDIIKSGGSNNNNKINTINTTNNNNNRKKKDLQLPVRQQPQAAMQSATSGVKPALDSIVRLTVMECHLVGLEQIFQKLDAVRSCREVLTGSRLSVADFQSTRIVVTGLIDDLKKLL